MRGRKPKLLSIPSPDLDRLHKIAHSDIFPGFKCSEPKSCWLSLPGNASAMSPPRWSVMKPRFGGPVNGIAGVAWRACSLTAGKGIRADRSRSPLCNGHKSLNWPVWSRLPRGCTSPTGPARIWPAKRLTTRSFPAISPATVRRILHDVDLQPHRTRYWKTARLEPAVQGESGASPLVLCQCGAAGRTGHLGGVCR